MVRGTDYAPSVLDSAIHFAVRQGAVRSGLAESCYGSFVTTPATELLIAARPRDLGGFSVRRALPSPHRRLVGPFIFFDHMGPADLPPGEGINVRPHPHIAIATVTYLFDGEIFHRDSLGSAQAITPGDVNWMIAGSGIVHSERTREEVRKTGQKIHGIQAWIALPIEAEEMAPAFFHHPGSTLPTLTREGIKGRVIAGDAFGLRSPVQVASPTLYVDLAMSAGATIDVPKEHEERAIYVAIGSVRVGEKLLNDGDMLVLVPGVDVALNAVSESRVLLLGGAKLEGERHIWWNFVSSSEERIEQAKRDWKERRFPIVAGDEVEFIPLP